MKHFHVKARLALLMALMMILTALPMTASAAGKEVTVGPAGAYETIQDAIDAIDGESDKTDWTIVVEDGTYSRFTVLSGMDGLTVKAAEGAQVIISTLDGSAAPAPVSGGHPDTYGISIRDAENVTIEGLTVKLGSVKEAWFASGISSYTQSSKGNNFTVKNCNIIGEGIGYGVFFDSGVTDFHIVGCVFDNVFEGVEMMCDGTAMGNSDISDNVFNNCSFAIHGYYGGNSNKAGTLNVEENIIAGTPELYSKVVLMDQMNQGGMKVNVKDNVFINALVGNVNLRKEGDSNDVRKENEFDVNSFYVEAIEPGTIEFYSTYYSPETSYGHWELRNPEGLEHIDIIQAAIDEANKNHSHVLSITSIPEGELIKTFTWFKDCIYWVVDPIPETGDHSNVMMWTMMTLVSMGAIAALLVLQKRKGFQR